ncbi:hypothetical protein EO087_06495 [Dyella sp. M7H15-1]|uniref:hypothetical protein n=1 Tax=Dyella sp. M7H15-1 TaxID=2501295 RepID=UPI001004D9C8|nr:hypothetical protein [Dyella sp. M7H15-1]QAU23676.1 hypothetical protein EO087_06495 [Dyella sp. M7H15-1]
MDKREVLKSIERGDSLTVWTTDGAVVQGRFINFDSDDLFLDAGGGGLQLYSLDEIDDIKEGWGHVEYESVLPETMDDQLKRIAIGKYLMIWGKFGGSNNETAEQGQLKSIDWTSRTVVLRNTIYNADTTVSIDKIIRIDESLNGPSHGRQVQEADWRLGPDGDWLRQ